MSLTKATFAMIQGAYVNVKDFGAKGDFNPTTGTGTDDRAAIQSAIDYAMTIEGGATVYFPPGNYSTGTGYTVGGNAAIQLLVGSRTTVNAANNITLTGSGANIYQGAEFSRVLTFSNANNCRVTGLNFYGNMGGTMTLVRATGSHLIMIELNSYNCQIDNCYLTNSAAWAIHIVGDCLDPSFGQDVCPKDVKIIGNTIKCRYGNGVKTYTDVGGSYPGTMTPWAFAVIQAEGLFVTDNVIMGIIDCENNGTTQTFHNVNITNNNFVSGWVTPIANPASSVATYWADEQTNPQGTVGAVEIVQGVAYNGVGTTDADNINVFSNSFENAQVYFYGASTSYPANISNNSFKTGSIVVGWFQGLTPQQTQASFVTNNNALQCSSGSDGFIKIIGLMVDCSFENNNLLADTKPIYDLSEYSAAYSSWFDDNSASYQKGDLTNTTKTVTISSLNGGYPMNVKFAITLLAYGGAGTGYLELTINGLSGNTALYEVTENVRNDYSAITIGSITKAANSFSFTIQNSTANNGVYQYVMSGNSPVEVTIA